MLPHQACTAQLRFETFKQRHQKEPEAATIHPFTTSNHHDSDKDKHILVLQDPASLTRSPLRSAGVGGFHNCSSAL